jgi:glycosyltransferase involved in cell wall biosynthesis/O-antigen/teichoic acid export membrane protein
MAINLTSITQPQLIANRLRSAGRAAVAPGSVFYASTMVANVIGFAYLLVLARVLTVAEYGEVVTLTALVYVFGVVTRSLQAKAAQTVTHTSEPAATRNTEAAAALRRMIAPLAAGTAVLFVVGAAISPWAAGFLRLPSASPVVLLAGYVATHFLLSGPRGVLLGSGRLYYLSGVTLLDPLARLGLGWALAGRLGTNGAMLGYVAGNLAATLAAVWPFLRLRRPHGSGVGLRLDRQFVYALVLNGALMALASVDPVAIRRYFSETVAGHYAVAFLLGRIILLSTNAVSWVVFAQTVNLRPNDSRVAGILWRGLALGGTIAGLFTIVYWLVPDLVTLAVGGSEFQPASGFVGLVGVEMLLFSLVSILAYYHIAIRNQRLWLPFAAALAVEAVLVGAFHASPQQILLDTTAVLGGLLAWVGFETMRLLRSQPAPAARPIQPRMAMVVHSHYPSDPRVRREAEALIEAGWEVDLICIPDDDQPACDVIGGVRVFRMPVRRQRSGGPLAYLREYGAFFLTASWHLAKLYRQKPYQVVQAHNMPDFLVFVGLLPRLAGARLILDIHDLVPEFTSVRFGLPPTHPVVTATRWVQKLSAQFADHVLTAGEPFRRQLVAAGLPAEKVTSIMNSPDPSLFAVQPAAGPVQRKDGFVLSYHGTLSEYNDLGVVLQAIALVREEMPGLRLKVYGRGRALPELQRQAAELGLDGQVEFLGFRPLDEMPARIRQADAGIVPQRRSVFTALNYPTKAFEYITVGVPVLMGFTPALHELFGHIRGSFFQPDSPEEIARCLRALVADSGRAHRMVQEQQAVCARFAWAGEKQRYVAVVNALGSAGRPVSWAEPA